MDPGSAFPLRSNADLDAAVAVATLKPRIPE